MRICFKKSDSTTHELQFATTPTVKEIRQAVGTHAAADATLYFKTPSRLYVPVEGDDLAWSDYACTDNGAYTLWMQVDTLNHSPEKNNEQGFLPAAEEMTAVFSQLSVSQGGTELLLSCACAHTHDQ